MMEQRRSLRQPFPVAHAVLAVLMEEPSHGYRIRQRLDDAFGSLWHIPTSQLYRVLERLTRNGWTTSEPAREGQRPERVVYTLTRAGEEQVWAWIEQPTTTRLELVAEFWTKLYFLRRMAPGQLGTWLAKQIEGLRGRLRAQGSAEVASDDCGFASLVAEYRELQLETVIAWMEEQAGKGRFG